MLFLLWISIGVIGRVIIHIPDVTPLTSLCLLAPAVSSKKTAFILISITLLVSDFLLHYFFHYPIFGSWTLFTYSGWFSIIFFGILLSRQITFSRGLVFTLFSSVFFWSWTNLGTWCMTTMYPHTVLGLWECYCAALPFLKNTVLGSMGWTAVLMSYLVYTSFSVTTQSIGTSHDSETSISTF